MKVMASEILKEELKVKITSEQKAKAILSQSVAFLLNADVIYDTAKKTNEEIFGSDSIRNAPDKLTGSQIGVAMGLSSYSTPLSLWKEKTRLEEIILDEDKEIFKAGHAAEDFVANMFARKLKEQYGENLEAVDIINDTNMYQSREYSWAIGQPDRFAIITFKSGKIELVGLECKTTYNMTSIKNWKDGTFLCPTSYEESGEIKVPATYDCQCREYMMTTDLDAWYICCCWGFTIKDCEIALIRRDSAKEFLIDEAARTFIQCCVEGMEPVVCEENLQAVAEYLNRKFDLNKADTVEADESFRPLFEKAQEAAALETEIKSKTKVLEKMQADIAKELLEKSDGKGTYFSLKDNEKAYGISLGIPHYANSIDVDGIKKDHPDIYDKMLVIGAYKVSKTDLEKIEIDGKKFDATPYVIEGGINATKPVKISKVTVKDLLT